MGCYVHRLLLLVPRLLLNLAETSEVFEGGVEVVSDGDRRRGELWKLEL